MPGRFEAISANTSTELGGVQTASLRSVSVWSERPQRCSDSGPGACLARRGVALEMMALGWAEETPEAKAAYERRIRGMQHSTLNR